MIMWIYTTIIHPNRIAMGLTNNEYCVLDLIYQTQVHPEYSRSGWCPHGNEKIGQWLGISRNSVTTIVNKLEAKGYVKKGVNGNKKTSAKWYKNAYEKVTRKLAGDKKVGSQESWQWGDKKVGTEGDKKVGSTLYKENKKEKLKEKVGDGFFKIIEKLSLDFDNPRIEKFADWLEYKKERKDKLTEVGLKRLWNKFQNYTLDELEFLIDHSATNGYQGLIWEKVKPNAKTDDNGSEELSPEYLEYEKKIKDSPYYERAKINPDTFEKLMNGEYNESYRGRKREWVLKNIISKASYVISENEDRNRPDKKFFFALTNRINLDNPIHKVAV